MVAPSPPRQRVKLGLALGASLLASGCLKVVAEPGCPAHGGHPWAEVTTKHFVVQTDVEAKVARATAEELERGYAELAAAAFPRGLGETERLGVIVLRDQREMTEYFPEMAGFSADRLGGDVEHTPTLVFGGSAYPPDVRAVFLHELTHRFVAYTYGPTPTWLNEGLAEYYSTLRVANGKLVLGETIRGAYVSPGVAPSVRELFAADQATFYAKGVAVPYRRNEIQALYYDTAFALVHYLHNGPEEANDERTRFHELRRGLASGRGFDEVWPKTLGQIPLERLEAGFTRYARAWSWDRLVYDAPSITQAPVERVRELAPEEIDLVWARLLSSRKETRARAKGALEAARSHAPRSPEVAFRAGAFLLQHAPAEAGDMFDDALTERPDDPRYLLGRALSFLLEWGDRSMPRDASVRNEEVLARLTRFARTADELRFVAERLADSGDHERALRTANRAIAVDPGYFGGRAALAYVHFAAGRLDDAISEQQRALALVPHGIQTSGLVAQLTKYRAARNTK